MGQDGPRQVMWNRPEPLDVVVAARRGRKELSGLKRSSNPEGSTLLGVAHRGADGLAGAGVPELGTGNQMTGGEAAAIPAHGHLAHRRGDRDRWPGGGKGENKHRPSNCLTGFWVGISRQVTMPSNPEFVNEADTTAGVEVDACATS